MDGEVLYPDKGEGNLDLTGTLNETSYLTLSFIWDTEGSYQ